MVGGFKALQCSVDRDSVSVTTHTEERGDKKDSEINFLETEKTKKNQETWEMARRKKKSNIYCLCQAKNESL